MATTNEAQFENKSLTEIVKVFLSRGDDDRLFVTLCFNINSSAEPLALSFAHQSNKNVTTQAENWTEDQEVPLRFTLQMTLHCSWKRQEQNYPFK